MWLEEGGGCPVKLITQVNGFVELVLRVCVCVDAVFWGL